MSAQQDYLPFIPKTLFGIPTGLLLIGLGFGLSIIKDKKFSQWGGPITYAGAGLFAIKDILPALNFGQTPPITCPTGQHLANGVCVPDVTTCTPPQVLVNGVCVTVPVTCPNGYSLVSGVCIADGGGGTIPPSPVPVGTKVTSLAALRTAVTAAAAGETIVLADGVYDNPARFGLTGRNGVNIVAEKRGITQIKGAPIDINSPGLTFSGFDLMYTTPGDYVHLNGDGIRFTRNRVHFGNAGAAKWIQTASNDIMIDHNEIFGKITMDNMVTIKGNPVADRCKIMYNYFHDMPGAGTPMECIRIGESSVAQVNYHAEVGYNRFENISADTEMCTWKCSTMTIHHNTMVNCNSSNTFRHGSFKFFADNICINSGGLRLYGHNHLVRGNQIIEDSRNQLRGPIVAGGGDAADDVGAPGMAGAANAVYSQVHDCIFENNLLISNGAFGGITFLLGSGATAYPPINNQIRNNIIVASRGTLAAVGAGASWANNTASGNILQATGTALLGDMPPSGYSTQDPLLVRMPSGIYGFSANSPLKWPLTNVYLSANDVGVFAP